MRERLPYIPAATVDAVLAKSDAFLSVDKELYVRFDRLDVPNEEREAALNFAKDKVYNVGFLTVGELPLGRLEARNEEAPPELLRRALFELALKGEFRLHGRLISEKEEKLNRVDVVRRFCLASVSRLDLNEIRDFALDLTEDSAPNARTLALEAAWTSLVCSEQGVFLPDRFLDFDVEATDAALDAFFSTLEPKREHAGSKEFTSFSQFPRCGVAWNVCVLESFCRRFSRRYRWEARSFNTSSCGAVFRVDSKKTFLDGASEFVAFANVCLNRSAVANVLIDAGYLADERSDKALGDIISKAKTIRKETF